ncbi:MAG: 7-cyano-7-deazaguanine synthase [Nanoarchaeota archaeon]|nr:7-cyano-7-deazaguanine synthase [Nanoarchaeota archaeon]
MENKKALVLFSGGLDSLLVIRLLHEQGFDVEALHFKLPFSCSSSAEYFFNENFKNFKNIKLTVFSLKEKDLFNEYFKVLKSPKYGRGVGMNPCIDCKVFIFKKAKQYADKNNIKIIATGEVLGERPMSQTAPALKKINDEIGFEILRPLSAKLLKETQLEKDKIVNRENLLAIEGRQRKVQMALAEKFNLKYPTPAGGCILCDRIVGKRIKLLMDKNLVHEKNLDLMTIGKHFIINDNWFIVGRNEKENIIIEKYPNSLESDKGKPAIYFNNPDEKSKALEIQKAYEHKNTEDFEVFKL